MRIIKYFKSLIFIIKIRIKLAVLKITNKKEYHKLLNEVIIAAIAYAAYMKMVKIVMNLPKGNKNKK